MARLTGRSERAEQDLSERVAGANCLLQRTLRLTVAEQFPPPINAVDETEADRQKNPLAPEEWLSG